MHIFKLILLTSLYSTLLLSNDKLLDSSFVGLSTGYVYADNEKDGSIEPDYKLDNSAMSYGVELGYRASENIFYTMNYSKYYFESRSFDNYYLSANYLFDLGKDKFSLYVGAIGGWGSILWRDDPINSIETSEKRSENYLVGAQVGFEYTIKEDLFLYYTYIYSYSPQDTLLYETTTISDSHRHNGVIGFRYYIDNTQAGR